MRKVLFKKWIPQKYDESNGYKPIPDTGKWEDDYKNEGLFHQWANAYEEYDGIVGNYTIALVELIDGTIVEVSPSNLKFVI